MFLAIIGRICGQEEDTVLVYETQDMDEAESKFRKQLQLNASLTDAAMKIAESKSRGVIIVARLWSDAKIERFF
jgi:hypothetical protein